MSAVPIPNRAIFRSQEVCELAGVQPYVLRTWEAEFPDLGVAKTANGPRVYRRADVERVLRIKDLLFVEGLTIAGARRQLTEEGLVPSAVPADDLDASALIDQEARQRLRDVRRDLHWILEVLAGRAADARGAQGPLDLLTGLDALSADAMSTTPGKKLGDGAPSPRSAGARAKKR